MKRITKETCWEDRLSQVLLINILCVCIAIAFVVIEWHIGYRIQCPIHQNFDVNCPGCGTTRLMESVLYDHNLYQAFRWNPYVFIMWPVVMLVWIYQNVFYIIKNKMSKYTAIFIALFAVTLILFGIVRNFSCLEYLAPTPIFDSVQ